MDLTDGCQEVVSGCRKALKHLHHMMYRSDLTTQQCNNFALKSIRAFFHDYMSNGVEGSIINENDLEMNVGLCRFTQYLNVLSDETQCDPGSILAMAGQLGFDACGVEIWRVDQDVMPEVQINRGFECEATGSRLNSVIFDQNTHQRLDIWNDAIVSANSTSQEKFWCVRISSLPSISGYLITTNSHRPLILMHVTDHPTV